MRTSHSLIFTRMCFEDRSYLPNVYAPQIRVTQVGSGGGVGVDQLN